MRILLSNDDGVRAPGIQTLASALREFAQVQIVAPNRNRSGASNALTLESPLRSETLANGDISIIDGTPTDCVYLGVNALMRPRPDIVIAGINAGPNLGDDVIYSGTVAAAMEGVIWASPHWPCRWMASAIMRRRRRLPAVYCECWPASRCVAGVF